MMPKKNGIEVCKEIKEKSSSKVVMLTAKNEDELKALNIGADEYIKKPFDPRMLLVRVKKLLNIENIIISGNIKVDLKGKRMFKIDSMFV